MKKEDKEMMNKLNEIFGIVEEETGMSFKKHKK